MKKLKPIKNFGFESVNISFMANKKGYEYPHFSKVIHETFKILSFLEIDATGNKIDVNAYEKYLNLEAEKLDWTNVNEKEKQKRQAELKVWSNFKNWLLDFGHSHKSYDLKKHSYFCRYIGKYIDADLVNCLKFFFLLLVSDKNICFKVRDNGIAQSFIFGLKDFDKDEDGGLDFLSFDFKKLNVEKFGYLNIKIFGRFEQIFEVYKKNVFGEEITNWFNVFCQLLKSLSINVLTRCDYYFDYEGTLGESINKINIYRKKAELFNGLFFEKGKPIFKENGTLYWGAKTSTILVRDYNKYDDSLKKKKLYLYPYLTKYTRRLEMQMTADYFHKLRNKIDNNSFKSAMDLIVAVYEYFTNQTIKNKNEKYYNYHFETPGASYFAEKYEKSFSELGKKNKEVETLIVNDYINEMNAIFEKKENENMPKNIIKNMIEKSKKVEKIERKRMIFEVVDDNHSGLKRGKVRFLTKKEVEKSKKLDESIEYKNLDYCQKIVVNYLLNMDEVQRIEEIGFIIKQVEKKACKNIIKRRLKQKKNNYKKTTIKKIVEKSF